MATPPRKPALPRRPLPPPRPPLRPKEDSGFWGGPAYWLLFVLLLGGGTLVVLERLNRPTSPLPVAEAPPPPPPRVADATPPVTDTKPEGSLLGDFAKPEAVADTSPAKVVDDLPPPPVYEPDAIDFDALRRYKTVSSRLTKAVLGEKPSREALAAHAFRASPKAPFSISPGDRAEQARVRGIVEAYWASIDPDRCLPHPDAEHFPGPIAPGADRVITAVNIPLNVPRRHSTGLYAAPGERITFRLSADDTDKGFVARIGCHSDNLLGGKRERWHRWPVLTNTKPLNARAVEMANPFGGPIYIEIPGRGEWVRTRERARVEIVGAVEAPFFELGKTTRAEWDNRRLAPAPWGELVSGKMVLSVPSELLRKLPYPEELMKVWEKIVDTGDWLAAIGPRRSPERLVADAEISIGWMHSGYPIMCYLASAPDMVSVRHLTTEGNWGFFHELGHNRQSRLWTYAGYTEVTCNLFSLICMERVAGKKVGQGHSDLIPLANELALDNKAHANSPFHLLAQYYHPIAAFGWEPLQATFDELNDRKDIAKADGLVSRTNNRAGRALTKAQEALEKEQADLERRLRLLDKDGKPAADKADGRAQITARLTELREEIKKAGEAVTALSRQDSDDKKKEIFVKIWSKHAGHDLGPYFATFGWPHTDHMKAFNKGLKPWMPKDFPPKPAALAGKPPAKSILFGSRNEAMADAGEVHGEDNPANNP